LFNSEAYFADLLGFRRVDQFAHLTWKTNWQYETPGRLWATSTLSGGSPASGFPSLGAAESPDQGFRVWNQRS